MPTRFELDRTALGDLLQGHPAYRVEQLWRGLYGGLDLEEITTLPKALRVRLRDELPCALTRLAERVSEGGDTVKFLWALDDGARIETVLMLYPGRATVCVSSQAGCAMACRFCATGQAGFERHLGVGEIVEQVVRATAHGSRAGPSGQQRGVHGHG